MGCVNLHAVHVQASDVEYCIGASCASSQARERRAFSRAMLLVGMVRVSLMVRGLAAFAHSAIRWLVHVIR